MKDNWSEIFQERLGDYELDIPVPAGVPGRRSRRLWLPLSAAAAVAALLLLLPFGKHAGTQTPQRLIAEAVPQLLPQEPALHGRCLHPVRNLASRQAEAEPAGNVGNIRTQIQTQDAEPAVATETETRAETEKEPEKGPKENTAAEIFPSPSAYADPWWDETPEHITRTGGFSTKAYAGNISFGGPRFINTPDLPLAADMMPASSNSGQEALYASNTMLAKAVRMNNVADTQVYETLCDLPLKAGLAVRYDFTPFFGIESGLTYSYHHAKQSYAGNINGSYYRDFRLHYLGIPLKADFTLARLERAAFYVNIGGEAEVLTSGSIKTIDGVTRKRTAVHEHPLQFSLLGSAGAEYFLTDRLGLYAEPGLAWHPAPDGSLPSYYREHPWSFDLRVGLRLRLN